MAERSGHRVYTVIARDDMGTFHRQYFDREGQALDDALTVSKVHDLEAYVYGAATPLQNGIPKRAPIARTCCCPALPGAWHLWNGTCLWGPTEP